MQNIFKLSQQNPSALSGPVIDRLIAMVHVMIARGAPTEFDDQGFNKPDWSSDTVQYIMDINSGSAIPLDKVIDAVYRLNKYKDRQLPEFPSLKAEVTRLIQESTPTGTDDNLDYGTKTVQQVHRREHGKEIFVIPNFSKGKRVLTRLLKVKLQELSEGGNNYYKQTPSRSQYNQGQMEWPVWKVFQRDKTGVDLYGIHPDVMSVVADLLESNGYEVSSLRNFSAQPAQPQTQEVKKVKSLSFNGGMLIINLGLKVEPAIDLIKMQPDRRAVKEGNDWIWNIPDPTIQFVEDLSSVLSSNGFDVSDIDSVSDLLLRRDSDDHIDQDGQPPAEDYNDVGIEANRPIARMQSVFDDTGGKWMASVKVFDRGLTTEYQTIFNDTVKYIFFGVTNKMNEHEENMQLASVKEYGRYDPSMGRKTDLGWRAPDGVPKWTKYLRGSINSFIDLGRSLDNKGFNIDEIRKTFSSLRKSGAFDEIVPGAGPREQRIRGTLDGFESETHEEEVQKFNTSSRSYESAFFEGKDFHFYKEQLEGIEFLYSRQSAILGDDTGVGKTVQCVVAADMRLKQSGGKCIIITTPAVIDQYREEVIKVTGLDESDVSADPYADAKYRVIGYSAFSTKSTRDQVATHLMEEAISGIITVMVLDEIHLTKTVSSKRSELIGDITKFVPFVWGASATTVANTPTDLYNQLRIVNHDFGKMPRTQFDALFGTKSGGKNLPKIEQYKRADKIKDILFERQVYTRRSKQSIREDMPEQRVTTTQSDIDHGQLARLVEDDLRGKSATPVVQLGSFRKVIAQMKVPHTISMAREILSQGRKVAIFTGFIEAGNLLQQGLMNVLDESGIQGGVARIEGGMKPEKRRRVVGGFKDVDGPRAIVIAIKAGGTGLDFPNILQDIIINDFEWSVKDDDQSLGRFYRINSQEDINVVYNIANVDLDQLLYQNLAHKKEIASRIQNLEAKETNLRVAGRKSGDEELDKVTQEKYEAYEARDKANEATITEGLYGKPNDDTTLASSYFSPRRSWYGILKTR